MAIKKPKALGNTARSKASASAPPPGSAPTKSKGWTLQTVPDPAGRTPDQFMAQVAADGIVGNARSLVAFGEATFSELSLTDCARVLQDTAQRFNDGDLSAAVTMLSSQAAALNAMFGELARVALANMFSAPQHADRYMRLALKAQGQTRATLETLAVIKNPPAVFARQANVNNGGQQQVNNEPRPIGETDSGRFAPAPARAEKFPSGQTELLGADAHEGTHCALRGGADAGVGLDSVGARRESAIRDADGDVLERSAATPRPGMR